MIAKICFCHKWYFSKLRYLEKKNYIFVAIFGESFFESGVQVVHLMKRNYVRIGRPGKIGGFVINIIRLILITIGPCLTFALILFCNRTTTGQLTSEIVATIAPALFTLIACWFIGRIFAGAITVSLDTVLLSAACDEEMFTREQRFVEADLLDFMDGIGEEQNEQHRENKIRVKIEGGYNGSSDFIIYKHSESIRPYFNKVLPSRDEWSDVSRSFANNSRAITPMVNIIPPLNVSERPSFMDDIREASMEDDMPSFSIGTPARYVNDD